MECEKCGSRMEKGDEAVHMGQFLCLDCYTDAISPAKPCDPWAVYSAKSLSQDGYILTKRQRDIIAALKEENGLALAELAARVGLETNALEREIATLRHMEKVRAVKSDSGKLFCLW